MEANYFCRCMTCTQASLTLRRTSIDDYIGPRNVGAVSRASSLLTCRSRGPVSFALSDRRLHLRAGGSVFNVFNHDNPRDVQNNLDSSSVRHFLQRCLERISREDGIRVLTMRDSSSIVPYV